MNVNPIFKTVSERLSTIVSENLRLPAAMGPTGISWGLDPAEQRIPVHAFTIERRQGAAFAEEKYFSSAPLPTDEHFALVEEFEKSVLKQK
jgi:hypothetical protein